MISGQGLVRAGKRYQTSAKKIEYKLTMVMTYGILTFVYQMASRREATRKMTLPMFVKNLKMLFPVGS
jgi:hypothetical protein